MRESRRPDVAISRIWGVSLLSWDVSASVRLGGRGEAHAAKAVYICLCRSSAMAVVRKKWILGRGRPWMKSFQETRLEIGGQRFGVLCGYLHGVER